MNSITVTTCALLLAGSGCAGIKGALGGIVKVNGEPVAGEQANAGGTNTGGSSVSPAQAPTTAPPVEASGAPLLATGKVWGKAGGKCKNQRKGVLNPFRNRHTVNSMSITTGIHAVADLNGDGRMDFITQENGVDTTGGGGNRQVIHARINRGQRADGSVEFEPILLNSTRDDNGNIVNATPNGAGVSDFDGDGDLDIIASSSRGGWDHGLVLYEYKGDETWEEHWVYDESFQLDMTLADLNGDGSDDIVFRLKDMPEGAASEDERDHFYWFPTKKMPLEDWADDRDWEEEKHFIFAVPSYGDGNLLGAFDLDGDGDQDLLYSDGSGSYLEMAVTEMTRFGWLENLEKGAKWKDHVIFDEGGKQLGYEAAYHDKRNFSFTPVDFDRDGDLDILFTVRMKGTISLLENNGKGTFSHSLLTETDKRYLHKLQPIDLDGDGDYEIVSYWKGREALNVYDYNEKTGKCKRQMTLHGLVDGFGDFLVADFDGDADQDLIFTGSMYHGHVSILENGPKRSEKTNEESAPATSSAAQTEGESSSAASHVDEGRPVLCTLDTSSMKYRICSQFQGGRCASWGPGCEPKERCEWDPDAEKFRQCRGPAHTCGGFKGTCEPRETCVYNPELGKHQPCKKFALGKCKAYVDKKCKPAKQPLVNP